MPLLSECSRVRVGLINGGSGVGLVRRAVRLAVSIDHDEALKPVTDAVDQQWLAEQLLTQTKAQGGELCPNRLLNQLTKTVLENASLRAVLRRVR